MTERTQAPAGASKKTGSWLTKHKWWVLGGGGAGVGLLAYLRSRSSSTSGTSSTSSGTPATIYPAGTPGSPGSSGPPGSPGPRGLPGFGRAAFAKLEGEISKLTTIETRQAQIIAGLQRALPKHKPKVPGINPKSAGGPPVPKAHNPKPPGPPKPQPKSGPPPRFPTPPHPPAGHPLPAGRP